MERIRLSKNEKKTLRLIASGRDCPDSFPFHVFCGCVRSLERKGLAIGAYVEGGDVEDACLTPDGRAYMAEYPSLRNPVDWKWWITTAIAVAALVIGLFACSRL